MRRVAAVLCGMFVLSGCGDKSGGAITPPPGGENPGSIAIVLPSTTPLASAGETRSAVGVVLDANQKPVTPSPTITWTSSDTRVATVTPTGGMTTITAVDDGTAIIRASSGAIKDSVVVTVRRVLASVVVSVPSVLTIGLGAQVNVVGLDARQNEITGLTGITYASDNPTTVNVSATGFAMALFQFPQTLTAKITATATKDGVTLKGSTVVTAAPPSTFQFGALLLSDYEQPRVPTPGAGIAYITRDGARLNYLFTWSALSGPAVSAALRGPGTYTDVSDVLVDLPLTPQSNTFGTVIGAITAADIHAQGGRPAISLDSLVTLLGTRGAYLQVRTAAFPNGEIRGQTMKFF